MTFYRRSHHPTPAPVGPLPSQKSQENPAFMCGVACSGMRRSSRNSTRASERVANRMPSHKSSMFA